MKKTTWLLLALSLVAMLLVAGCAPTTPKPSPSPSPTVAPTPTPGVAPKVVKTMVTKGQGDGEFKITIVFDKDVYSSCAENWRNWTVRVVNSQRREGNRNIPIDDLFVEIVGNQIILYGWVAEEGTPVITYALVALPQNWTAFDFAASVGNLPAAITAAGKIIADAQKVVDAVNALSAADLAAFLVEHHTEYDALLLALNAAKAAKAVLANPAATPTQIATALADLDDLEAAYGPTNGLGLKAVETGRTAPRFPGLICSEDDAAAYKKAFGIEVTAADVVTWSLSDNCTIFDVLGNSQCGYSGSACCLGPECEECVECDLTTGVCK